MIYHCLVGCITVSFVVALIDLFRGSPWGVGNELQRGFDMAGPLLLLMTGYICLAPVLAAVLKPSLLPLAHLFGVEQRCLDLIRHSERCAQHKKVHI